MTARGATATMLAIIVAGVGIDQATKAVAIARLVPDEPVRVVSDIVQFQIFRNAGAAFSTGTSLTVVFSVLALAVLVAVCVWVMPKVRSALWAVAVGMGMAGVAGNFIDRLVRSPGVFRGHVIDFISVKHFAVFNVADMLLTCAAALIVLIVFVAKVGLEGEPATYRSTSKAG